MKIKQIVALTSVAFSLQLTQAANVVINFVPNNQGSNQLNHAAEVSNGTVFTTINTTGTAAISTGIDGTLGTGRGTLGSFTISEGGFTGTFDISLEIDSNNTTDDPAIQRGGVGALGVLAGNGLQAGQTLTISNVVLTHVSGDDVFQFDGFSGVYFGASDGTEEVTVNGVTVTAVASGNLIETGHLQSFADIAGVDTLLAGGTYGGASGTTTLNGLQAQFSVIPEPSSALLLSLSGFALLRRRR